MSTKKDEVRYSVEALRWERALKLALEALEYFCVSSEDGEDLTPAKIKKAITAIREALSSKSEALAAVPEAHKQPAQPSKPWVGLTQHDIDIAFDDTQEGGGFNEFAYAIEAKLREKNEPLEKNA